MALALIRGTRRHLVPFAGFLTATAGLFQLLWRF